MPFFLLKNRTEGLLKGTKASILLKNPVQLHSIVDVFHGHVHSFQITKMNFFFRIWQAFFYLTAPAFVGDGPSAFAKIHLY